MKTNYGIFTPFIFCILMVTTGSEIYSQPDPRKFWIAKLEIYPAYVQASRDAPAGHATTAVNAEPRRSYLASCSGQSVSTAVYGF